MNANSCPSSPVGTSAAVPSPTSSQISARSFTPPPGSPASHISEASSNVDNKYLDVELELAKSIQNQQPLENSKPKLRLNTTLAADPATNPEAKDLKDIVDGSSKGSEEFESSLVQEGISTPKFNRSENQIPNTALSIVPLNIESVPVPPRHSVYTCVPCGIKFSSVSTLEAHQTYYCSHRKEQDEPTPSLPKASSSDHTSNDVPAKVQKTGKQYACTQCSYSADKKVSLNRHMRMHQSSPAPSSVTSNGDEVTTSQMQVNVMQLPVDRYCSDCDIRFSSTKTYRAHKQHYCQSRHREG